MSLLLRVFPLCSYVSHLDGLFINIGHIPVSTRTASDMYDIRIIYLISLSVRCIRHAYLMCFFFPSRECDEDDFYGGLSRLILREY